jgi:hypothetical protein
MPPNNLFQGCIAGRTGSRDGEKASAKNFVIKPFFLPLFRTMLFEFFSIKELFIGPSQSIKFDGFVTTTQGQTL